MHGRVMVLMTHNTDISDSWEREGEDASYFLRLQPEGLRARHQRPALRPDALIMSITASTTVPAGGSRRSGGRCQEPPSTHHSRMPWARR